MEIAWCCAPELDAQQQTLLRQRALQYGVQPLPDRLPESGLYLAAEHDGLSLACVGEKGRVRVDFVGGGARHRRLYGGGELLGRAVKHTAEPRVWDATGGLGRDAFVLASLGLRVTVFERHPVVAALLADGLARALAAGGDVAEAAGRMHLLAADARQADDVSVAAAEPDVVYLDPMYPQRQKSAAVKKEMAYFHRLLGAPPTTAEEADLLAWARARARQRVVVKRPQGGQPLAGSAPDYQYAGKSTRFDVYRPAV